MPDWLNARNRKRLQVHSNVRYSGGLPFVFAECMKQHEEQFRAQAAYLHAVAVMIQIPGGAEFESTTPDREADEENDPVPEEHWDFIREADRDTKLSILAECFERLEADEALIEQLTGAKKYKPVELPCDFRITLAEQDQNGLLNIVADCLDRLIVIPNMTAYDKIGYE